MTPGFHPQPPAVHVRHCAAATLARPVTLHLWALMTLMAALLTGLTAASQAAPDSTRLTAPPALPAAQLRLALTSRTTMVYEPRRVATPLPLAGDGQGETPPSLGLEFRSPPAQHGARSILRVQLSGDAALQFRPRRRGLAISYRAQF